MASVYINIIVAASNLLGLFFIQDIPSDARLLIYAPMLASIIYHLAEVKHGLSGVYPLNVYAVLLLWIYRFFAAISAAIVVFVLWHDPCLGTFTFWMVGMVGLFCLALSEGDTIYRMLTDRIVPVSVEGFLFTHSVWHPCAFYCLSLAIRHLL